jgi:hypothetical protein
MSLASHVTNINYQQSIEEFQRFNAILTKFTDKNNVHTFYILTYFNIF